MIFFRVDGNENIGTGHLMRCISIASELEKKGEPYKFIVSDDDSADFLSRFDISCICLHSDWKDLDSEVEQIKDVLAEYGNTVLLIDSYYVTKEYFKEIKKLAKIFYIDDLCKDIYLCDGLINYSVYSAKFEYDKKYDRSTKLYLGCKYTPLGLEYNTVVSHRSDHINNVLVTTGGSDPCEFTYSFLESLKDDLCFETLVFHVIIGRYFKNKEEIKRLGERIGSNIVVHENLLNLAEVMSNCDAAISSGGTTLYELASLGIPTICFSFVDNQQDNCEYFSEKPDYMCYVGDYRTQEDIFVQIKNHLKDLSTNHNKCRRINKNLKLLVDGRGSERIASILMGEKE